MSVLRTLVWALNLGGAILLWSAAESEPLSRAMQIRLACVAAVMALTLVYVCLLEAGRKQSDRSPGPTEPASPTGKERGL